MKSAAEKKRAKIFYQRRRDFKDGYTAGLGAGPDIINLFNSHLNWATVVFPKATAIGALLHLEREVKEVIADIENYAPRAHKIEEYADCMGCLLSSMARENISVEELMQAFEKKLIKNQRRKWKDNGDGSYSHIKEKF